jgi:hypothetical protein
LSSSYHSSVVKVLSLTAYAFGTQLIGFFRAVLIFQTKAPMLSRQHRPPHFPTKLQRAVILCSRFAFSVLKDLPVSDKIVQTTFLSGQLSYYTGAPLSRDFP